MKTDLKDNNIFDTIKEKSCGAVIYKVYDNSLYFLIIKQTLGHFSFPKGHVENYESEEETAIREVKEEVNLDIKLDTNFREVNTYSPQNGVVKDVIFFLGEVVSGEIFPQEEEVEEIFWLKYNDAKDILTYQSDAKILDKAYQYIAENKVNCTFKKA